MFGVRQLGISAILVLILGISAEAQSKLNFPRQLSAQELSTTGFALVNTSSAAVSATFSFYGTNGSLVTQSAQDVPAKGQLARLASEIFPTVTAAGWVQVESSSSELQGFELVGNFATIVDGAGPAAEGRQLALIDFSREDIVHIVNTSSQSGTVQVTLNSAAGASLGTRSIPLAPFQPSSLRLGDVNDDNSIDLVTLSADVNISASMTTKLPGGLDIGLTNATLISGAGSTLFFPFAPNGPQGTSNWTTYLGISNLASTAQSVSLTFTPDTGAAVTIQRSLAPGASLGDTVVSLFSLPSNTFTAGWIRVTGAGALTGVAAYQDSANGSLAIVPSQSSGASAFFFGHIASLSPWYTGIALLNTTGNAANVEVYAIASSGQLVGSVATFSLPAGRRTALLSEFVPQVLQRASDGGWVFVRTTNDVPLLGFELFGHALFPILANVQGFALPPSSTFTPPVASTPEPNIDLVTITDGAAPKTEFVPRDSIFYQTTVRSTGGNVSAELTLSVKDPQSQTLLTNSSTVALTTNPANITLSSFIPSNALNGDYIVTATLTYQGKTATNSAAFRVALGTNTPTVGMEIPLSTSQVDVSQVSFRPGDTVRFVIPSANFTAEPVMGVLNYQLTGAGSSNAGSGSQSYSIPTGISFRTIELVIPTTARGLLAFRSTLTAGGITSTKGRGITVVPKSASETIFVDQVFVSDISGTPRGGFVPGSDIILTTRRLSLFGVTMPATLRYTITGPDATILNQSSTVEIPNGSTVTSLPVKLAPGATQGSYTAEVALTYFDNDGVEKTTGGTATFAIGNNPPPMTQNLTTLRLYVMDANRVARTFFNTGELFVFTRDVYSTYGSPISGSAQHLLNFGTISLVNQTLLTTFIPGINSEAIPFQSMGGNQASNVTLTYVVTASIPGGPSSTSTTTFLVNSPDAPSLNFGP